MERYGRFYDPVGRKEAPANIRNIRTFVSTNPLVSGRRLFVRMLLQNAGLMAKPTVGKM
jgi:hypothetical protein